MILFLMRQQSFELQQWLNPQFYTKHYKWVKLPNTRKKLNVDGSCKHQQNLGSIGCVLRDDKGDWIRGFAAQIRQPTVNEMELHSLLKGL